MRKGKKHAPTLEELSRYVTDDFKRLNPELYNGAENGSFCPKNGAEKGKTQLIPSVEADHVHTRLDSLNKTERRFYDTYLVNRSGEPVNYRVVVQPTRFFEIPGGGTYTPDFLVFQPGRPVEVIEIKGGYCGPGWEQGIERYKRAANIFHGDVFTFKMCTFDRKKGTWNNVEWRKER